MNRFGGITRRSALMPSLILRNQQQIKNKMIHTSKRCLSKEDLYFFDKLPGEGHQPQKGVEKIFGPLRAERFAKSLYPVLATPEDVFDVAIGNFNNNNNSELLFYNCSYMFLYVYLYVKSLLIY